MHVARHKLGEGVHHGDNWLAEIGVGHSVARHSARAPAMLRPWVVVAERYLGMLYLLPSDYLMGRCVPSQIYI